MINWFKKFLRKNQKVNIKVHHFNWWQDDFGQQIISVSSPIKGDPTSFSYQEIELDSKGMKIADQLKKWITRNAKYE